MLEQVMQNQQQKQKQNEKDKNNQETAHNHNHRSESEFILSPLSASSFSSSVLSTSPLSQLHHQQKNINVEENSWIQQHGQDQQLNRKILQHMSDSGDNDIEIDIVHHQLNHHQKQKFHHQKENVSYYQHRSLLAFSEVKLLIESNKIGAIIGVRGETIKKIREISGASINVNERYGTYDRQVLISGIKEQIIEACSLIMSEIHSLSVRYEKVTSASSISAQSFSNEVEPLEKIHEKEYRFDGHNIKIASMANGNLFPQLIDEKFDSSLSMFGSSKLFEIRLLIMNSKIGALIGKSGATIKQIRAVSSCQIRIAKDALLGSSLEERIVVVIGTLNQVRIGLDLILSKLNEAALLSLSGGNNYSLSSPYTFNTMDIRGSDYKRVGYSPISTSNLSSSNSIWSAINAPSSTSISASSASTAATTSNILLSLIDDTDDSDDDLYKSNEFPSLLKNSLSFDEEDLIPQNAASSHSQSPKQIHVTQPAPAFNQESTQLEFLLKSISLSMENKDDKLKKIQESLYIPERYVGRIIGKGGSTINEIRLKSGAEIKIQPRVGNSPTRVIILIGTSESIKAAKHLISWFLY